MGRQREDRAQGGTAGRQEGRPSRAHGWAVNRCSRSQGSVVALGVLLFVGLFVRFNFFFVSYQRLLPNWLKSQM